MNNLQFYDRSAEDCYRILRDTVLPTIKAGYWFGLNGPVLRYGTIWTKVQEEDWNALYIEAQFRIKVGGILPAPAGMGPPFRIYCKADGREACAVEIIATDVSVSGMKSLNTVYKYSLAYNPYRWLFKAAPVRFPSIFVDDIFVLNTKELYTNPRERVARIWENAFHYLFRKIQSGVQAAAV
ncbi:MAG: hypothetical protein AB1941_02850 [Gemmatimonadota bacterium]